MKLLTLNFLTCARKACKSSPAAFPLHPKDAELEQVETDVNPIFLQNILPRLDWEAMKTLVIELGLQRLPAEPPAPEALRAGDDDDDDDDDAAVSRTGRDLHGLLIETAVKEGKLVCANCGHEYAVKEGIANFLLPSHLV